MLKENQQLQRKSNSLLNSEGSEGSDWPKCPNCDRFLLSVCSDSGGTVYHCENCGYWLYARNNLPLSLISRKPIR